MRLLFVHGWSVTNQDTYGGLAEALVAAAPDYLNLDIHHIHLGKYISFHDEVTLDDIARAFDKARLDAIGEESFSCITHSTGGPVVRLWAHLFYGSKFGLEGIPLKHLVMLAPANHGSALAQLGKGRLSRINSFFDGIEPGVEVLNWLELGSSGQWDLNLKWLDYIPVDTGFYQFVLSGQTIDSKFYDYVNSYLVEKGSDGVVRLAAANMNYRYFSLRQDVSRKIGMVRDMRTNKELPISELKIDEEKTGQPEETPFCIVAKASHSGAKIGIMKSVTPKNAIKKSVVNHIVQCLGVQNRDQFKSISDSFKIITENVQMTDRKCKDQYAMLVFRITDDRKNPVKDFDMLLLAGNDYRPDILPKGFFVDRQRNTICHNVLTYYVNCSKMKKARDGKVGIRISAKPSDGFSYYSPAEFRSNGINLNDILIPNQTTLIDIELVRHVDENTFRFTTLEDGKGDFKKAKPSGKGIPY